MIKQMSQPLLIAPPSTLADPSTPDGQLLKWIGNKQRMALEIIEWFPGEFETYYEPFLGSGALLGTLMPRYAVASDAYGPLVEIWQCLKSNPDQLVQWYSERCAISDRLGKAEGYAAVLASFNANPNGADLVFLCRACYGGVVRFRKYDGFMSTPVGIHKPIPPASFRSRVKEWHGRVQGAEFLRYDYREIMAKAKAGDLIYCDPPYTDTQTILYGAQSFSLPQLMDAIADCKRRGVYVALSIDGTKKSGKHICNVPIPDGLFARDVPILVGRSMLKRFQRVGEDVSDAVVTDRLLLTY